MRDDVPWNLSTRKVIRHGWKNTDMLNYFHVENMLLVVESESFWIDVDRSPVDTKA